MYKKTKNHWEGNLFTSVDICGQSSDIMIPNWPFLAAALLGWHIQGSWKNA